MSRDETIARFKKGVVHWNNWSVSQFEKKRQYIQNGVWEKNKNQWESESAADFENYEFNVDFLNFEEFIFPWTANFYEANFKIRANFENAKFFGEARFGNCIFNKPSNFSNIFSDNDLIFSGCLFKKLFMISGYIKGRSFFYGTIFEGAAIFEKSSFAKIPNFCQTHFREAPDLDNTRVASPFHWGRTTRWLANLATRNPDKKRFCGRDPDPHTLAARYRALRRMAKKGENHFWEQEALAGELRAERSWRNVRTYPQQIVGILYQVLSNFGRSFVLPLLWWVGSIAGFRWWYLGDARIWPWVMDGDNLPCVPGMPDDTGMTAGGAAWELSVKRALIAFGFRNDERTTAIYQCLTGHTANTLPTAFVAVEIGQMMLSLLLIFMFLHALRVRFRVG